MYINNEKKIVINHVPKTAGTSILYQLGSNNEPWHIFYGMHGHWSIIFDKSFDLYEDIRLNWKKFTTVRNPWDHAVSYYFHIIDKKRFGKERMFMSRENYQSFEKFLEHHNYTQEYYTFQCSKFINDYWIRYEYLQEDFNNLCDVANYERQTIVEHNKTEKTNNHYGYVYPDDYRDMYTNDRMIEMVYEKSKRTVEKFGYSF